MIVTASSSISWRWAAGGQGAPVMCSLSASPAPACWSRPGATGDRRVRGHLSAHGSPAGRAGGLPGTARRRPAGWGRQGKRCSARPTSSAPMPGKRKLLAGDRDPQARRRGPGGSGHPRPGTCAGRRRQPSNYFAWRDLGAWGTGELLLPARPYAGRGYLRRGRRLHRGPDHRPGAAPAGRPPRGSRGGAPWRQAGAELGAAQGATGP